MSELSISVPLVKAALAGAQRLGYDRNRFLKECGISPVLLENPRARVALDRYISLVQKLMRELNDECMGFLERPVRVGTFALVTRSTLHEQSLLDAMHCYARAYNLLDNGLVSYCEEQKDRVIYGLRRSPELQSINSYIVESYIMTAHRYFCWLSRARIPLLSAELDYAKPPWVEDHRYLFYGAPAKYRCAEIKLVFMRKDVNLPLKQDIQSLNEYIARAPRDIFTPTLNPSVSYQARQHILEHMKTHHSLPAMEDTAQNLGYLPQTFWRRLKREGTDYTQVRTQARRDVAIWMLTHDDHSVERIAEMTGFSEASAFIRAFKDWTGLTPKRYRRL